MSNNKRLIQTISVSVLSVLIGYAINFIITPYITENLGVEAYSFVSIANTTVSYAGIITIALTAFIVRYISVSYHENNLKDSRAYYSSAIEACIASAFIILFIALLVITQLEKLLNIPIELVSSVKFLFVIVFINFAVTTITTPFSTAAYIKNRLDLTGMLKIIAKVIESIVLIAMFTTLAANVWFVATGSLVATIVTLFFSIFMTHNLTPELKFTHSLVSIERVNILVRNGVWDALNQLGNVLNSGLDLIISNLLLTGIETGQIAIAKNIGSIFSILFQTLSQPFQPLLIKSYASGNKDNFLKEVSKAMKVCGFFGAVSFAGFAALGDLYLKLWLPSQDSMLLHMLTLLTVFNNITDSILRPVYYISTLTVKNKIPCWITIAGGIINIGAMVILLKHTSLGVYAVVLTTLVIMITINLAFNPIYAAWCIDTKPTFFYKIIFKHLLATFIMGGVFILIRRISFPIDWIGLILNAIVMACIGVVIYVILMCNKNERISIKSKIIKIFKR